MDSDLAITQSTLLLDIKICGIQDAEVDLQKWRRLSLW